MQARMLVHARICELQPILMTTRLIGVHKLRESDENKHHAERLRGHPERNPVLQYTDMFCTKQLIHWTTDRSKQHR